MIATENLLRSFDKRARRAETPVIARLIDDCIDAAKAAMVCADACAPIAHLFRLESCMHQTRAASDLCWATAVALLHADADQDVLKPLIESCRVACERAARGCAPHAPNHEFCRIGGQACERASVACSELLSLWSAEGMADHAH